MANSKINNDWYLYQNDVYGVNGLITFQNKQQLLVYITGEDFIETSAPDGLPKSDISKIKDLTDKFAINKITNVDYAQELLNILIKNEGEIDEMHIEDFESICQGKTKFAVDCIGGFYSEKEVNALKVVPEIDKNEFKAYFDNAEDSWIG